MQRFTGLLGIAVILGIAYLLSNNRKAINIRIVLWGLGLQWFFAIFILATPVGKPLFFFFDRVIRKLLQFSDEGAKFVFNNLAVGPGSEESLGFFFAFQVLPTIIFFSSFMVILYHFGFMQVMVRLISRGMQKTMGTSGSETLSCSSNIFVGQTEAPLVIRPFLESMTRSELTAIMTGGFATIAGGVLAVYVKWLADVPNIAGHLMAASVMSAPAALVMAKIVYPETEESPTKGDLRMDVKKLDDNVMEAVARGATDGMRLAANVAAMLIAIVALVAALNYLLGLVDLSFQQILGWVFSPLAFCMGVPLGDIFAIGSLMGEKIVLTELIAFGHLQEMSGQLNPKSIIIASYALCGFANFASIGIQIGGIGALAPDRRKDLAKVALKAMTAGALASWLTATIAGMLL
ncbi:MAG: nucleoside transporter C-terminal domain-containing protein [Candidatus Neomarinimicrobiota bacterium]